MDGEKMINVGQLIVESKRRNFKNKESMLNILKLLNENKEFTKAKDNNTQINILKNDYLTNESFNENEYSVIKSLIYGLELESDPNKIQRKR
jgi:hypothetical protein